MDNFITIRNTKTGVKTQITKIAWENLAGLDAISSELEVIPNEKPFEKETFSVAPNSSKRESTATNNQPNPLALNTPIPETATVEEGIKTTSKK